jgi:7-carboxy-7-deazaguanine synthase
MINIYPVQEIFGPTIQGEGPQAGGKTIFVRFAGCDYDCLWCDTQETWKIKDQDRMTAIIILERIEKLNEQGNCNHVTLTGGNPLLYDLEKLVDLLHALDYKVAVETQGSKYKPWIRKVDNIVISPKPPSSSNLKIHESPASADNFRNLYGFFHKLMDENLLEYPVPTDVTIKVPIFNSVDFEWFLKLKNKFAADNTYKWYLSVGNENVREEGSIQERLLQNYEWLVNKVIKSDLIDVYVLPQLHTLIWGNKKGV